MKDPAKSHDLYAIRCPKCGLRASEVVFAEKGWRIGWLCHKLHLTKATGRERFVEKPNVK